MSDAATPTLLDEFKKIYVVGTGGTGSFLLPPLVRYVNSLDNGVSIVFIDGDKYDEGNIARQEFAHSRIGKNKAEAQYDVYSQKFPGMSLDFCPNYLGEDNIDMIEDKSVVFCCVDNHFARHLISEYCKKLDNVLLISGGNEKFDGNVQPYFKREGTEYTVPIEKIHPEIGTTNDGDRSAMSCEELAALPGGGQVIFANLFSATIMVCLFYSYSINHHVLTSTGRRHVAAINEIMFDTREVKAVRVIDEKIE